MISGMIPMSLGLEEGSEQNAPLGRAVIGGMAFATFATLLVLPAVFTLLLGRASNQSPSLDPDDPASTHYDPIHPRRRPPADGRPARAAEPPRPATGGRTPCRRQSLEPRMSRIHRAVREAPALVALALLLAAGCGHSDRGGTSANRKAAGAGARRARPPASGSSSPSGATSG